MSDNGGDSLFHRVARKAGRQFEETKREYTNGRTDSNIPRDENGRAKIVCRRHDENRAVTLGDDRTPDCYDPENPACNGCLQDIREESVETW